MAYLTNSMGLFAKPETVSGTSSDPLDKTNNFVNPVKRDTRVREMSMTEDAAKDDENSKIVDGTFVGDESIIGMTTDTVDFYLKLAPGQVTEDTGVYTHELPYDKYLGSCGLKQIKIFDDSVVESVYQYPIKYLYYPTIEKYEDTITIDIVEKDPKPGVDAQYGESVGSIGNMVMTADTVGAPFKMAFTYSGGLDGVFPIPSAQVPNLDYNPDDVMKTVADKFLNTSFVIRDIETQVELTGVCVGNFTFDQGNQTTLRDCSASSSGVKSYAITGMQPRFSFDPELIPLDEFDYYKALTEERFYEIEVESKYKSATGEVVLQYFIPKAQLINANIVDDENFRRIELEWRPLGNTEKTIPNVVYQDTLTGADTSWDGAELSELQKYEAMYYMIVSEVPIGFTPVPNP